jgi:hypothetical protein
MLVIIGWPNVLIYPLYRLLVIMNDQRVFIHYVGLNGSKISVIQPGSEYRKDDKTMQKRKENLDSRVVEIRYRWGLWREVTGRLVRAWLKEGGISTHVMRTTYGIRSQLLHRINLRYLNANTTRELCDNPWQTVQIERESRQC